MKMEDEPRLSLLRSILRLYLLSRMFLWMLTSGLGVPWCLISTSRWNGGTPSRVMGITSSPSASREQ
jgi:hypothetical protein